MTNIYSVSLAGILPESLKSDPQVKALADAITPELQAVSTDIAQCVLLSRIDELPEEVIDLLAWQMHIDWYDATLTVEKKRNLIKTSTLIHKTRGTPYAVEQALSTIFDDSWVSEWFNYGGDPYMFKVVTTDRVISQISIDNLKKAINSVKNTRSWLESFTIQRDNQNEVYSGGCLHIGKTITLTTEGV